VDEPIDICEAGEEGIAPLMPPADTEKAKRHFSADQEQVLGWRPALGLAVPETRWMLKEKLGEGGFGEVWLAEQLRSLNQRRARIKRRKTARIASVLAGFLLITLAVTGLMYYRTSKRMEAAERELYFASISQAQTSINDAAYRKAEKLLFACPEKYRNGEWGHLLYLCNLDILTFDLGYKLIDMGGGGFNPDNFLSPDGKYMACAAGSDVRIYDALTTRMTAFLERESKNHVVSTFAFSSGSV
jgi:hypothetical protein